MKEYRGVRLMNKRLDDLLEQADKQLQDLEEEARAKDSANPTQQEVDRETALRFNQTHPPKEPFATRHPYQAKIAAFAFLMLLAAGIYMKLMQPRATGPYHLVTGTVTSSSIIWSGRTHWGSVAAEKVSLPDGRVVTIRSDSGILLRTGTPIVVRVYDTGAIISDQLL
jgi:hypothetical protein